MFEVVRGHPGCTLDGWAVVDGDQLVACAVSEDVARAIVAARPGGAVEDAQRAAFTLAAQRAAFALFAFNPHQRRGPDGKWIKMPTSELKRPRRPRKPKKAAAAPKPAKEATPRTPDPGLSDRIARMERQNRAIYGPNESKWPPEDRAALALARHELSGQLDPDSELPQVLIPDEFPNYREDRDRYNQTVIGFARNLQANLRAGRRADGNLQFYIDSAEESLREGNEDHDASIDLLRQELDRDYGGRSAMPPPPAGGGPRPPLAILPPGRRTSGGPRPFLTDRYGDRRQALDRSVRSGIVDQDVIGDGAMGDTRRVILADGTEAIYKRARKGWGSDWGIKEQTDAEELSALVAAAVGVRAPAIQRADDANLYMEVMPGQTAAQRNMYQPPQSVTDSLRGMRMGLLDVLLNNSDRHAGNWMIDLDNNIAAIDHGLAFKNDNVERSGATLSPFVGLFIDQATGEYRDTNPLTRRDVEQVRSDLEQIRPRFEELGRDDWFGQVELRLERLASRAAGYRPLLEDAPAMF